ncbi:MAG TPA: hypothetical protein VMM56_05975 [Planctomycetaceae bacterium]|nr:hypothetical protein [Planctomycetaceae bacterium]
MSRTQFSIAIAILSMTVSFATTIQAQTQANSEGPAVQLTGGIQPSLLPPQIESVPAFPVANTVRQDDPRWCPGGCFYPQTNAPLYPSAQPNVPYQVGGTVITNQAFAPHEMLYPHDYRAMYGPFYYVVKGHWVVTPWGVRNNECWELQGTQLDVKYRARAPLFSGFHPIRRR